MEQVFKRAIEQSGDQEPTPADGFLCYDADVDVCDLAGYGHFQSLLEDYDEDADHFGQQMTRLYGYVDFEANDLCDAETGLERYACDIGDVDGEGKEEEQKEGQAIVKPHFAIGPFHWTVVLHKDSGLPQVLGGELLESVFLLNDVLADHRPIVGFNSLLAGAHENKLHVECLLGTAHPDHRPVLLANLPMEVLLTSSLTRKEMDDEPAVIRTDDRVTSV